MLEKGNLCLVAGSGSSLNSQSCSDNLPGGGEKKLELPRSATFGRVGHRGEYFSCHSPGKVTINTENGMR